MYRGMFQAVYRRPTVCDDILDCTRYGTLLDNNYGTLHSLRTCLVFLPTLTSYLEKSTAASFFWGPNPLVSSILVPKSPRSKKNLDPHFLKIFKV